MNKRRVLFVVLLVFIILIILLTVRNSQNIRREARHQYWDIKKQIRRVRDSTEIKTLS
jgi:hypothetical protein